MFAELHGRMWVVNAGLNSPHYFQSWPKDWPFLRRGLGFWNGGQMPRSEAEIKQSSAEKDPKRAADTGDEVTEEEKNEYRESYKELTEKMKGKQIYLLGNVITWHTVTLAIFTLLTLVGSAIIIEQRIKLAPGFGYIRQRIQFIKSLIEFEGGVMYCLMSWLLHYVPFYLMGRQLFLHHYLPALYCGIMMVGLLMDKVVPEKSKGGVFALVTGLAVVAFVIYAPLAYGTKFKLCKALKLKSQWDWDCSQ